MPKLELRNGSGNLPPVDLGQVDIGLTEDSTDPVLMVVTNRDKFDLSEVRVRVDGPGAGAVQLARDVELRPQAWTNGEIIALTGMLTPNQSCQFWARAIADNSLELGEQEFEFVINAVAMKEE
jgi:hypothetical protein